MFKENESSESRYPKTDRIKKKKTYRSHGGTVQDTEWRIKEEPDDFSRHQVYNLNGVQGEYEN